MKQKEKDDISKVITKYINELPQKPMKQPVIYGVNFADNISEDGKKTFLTEKNIRDYIHYKKKQNINTFDDVKMLVYYQKYGNGYIDQIQTTLKDIIDKEVASNNNKGDVIRKVLFSKQQNESHMGCFVIFIDKRSSPPDVAIFIPKADKPTIWELGIPDIEIASSKDETHKKLQDAMSNQKIKKYVLDIQKDTKSCGIVAIKMAKHLTPQWYKDHKHQIQNINTDEKCFKTIPIEIYPPKLLTYKQGDLMQIMQTNPDVARNNIEKGYIKYLENKNANGQTEGKNMNTKLQESKIRRLYENYYQQEKAKTNKTHSNYRNEKQHIIDRIRQKFDNGEPDIQNPFISEADKNFITYINK